MRLFLFATLLLVSTPAFAQFPPPGIYSCADGNGHGLGKLSLLVAGDYQFDDPAGNSSTGQVASAADSVEALTGPLAAQHWKGNFATEAGKTTFVFTTDVGPVTCAAP